MTIDEMIAVLQAARENKPIQVRRVGLNTWQSLQVPHSAAAWDFLSYEYRVKPEPREWWINLYGDGIHTVSSSRKAALENASVRAETIHVREVLEDQP